MQVRYYFPLSVFFPPHKRRRRKNNIKYLNIWLNSILFTLSFFCYCLNIFKRERELRNSHFLKSLNSQMDAHFSFFFRNCSSRPNIKRFNATRDFLVITYVVVVRLRWWWCLNELKWTLSLFLSFWVICRIMEYQELVS